MTQETDEKVEGWLSQLNLPQIILGRAGKAISELVGSAVDIPKAGIERVSSKIRAETERQIAFDDKVHEKASELALGDDAFVMRAINKHAERLLKGQSNREKIAKAALDDLSEEGVESADVVSEEIPEDWMNHFSAHAEKVSSEQMQSLWAKVLAGQIRKPGEFSLSTLRMMSELDQSIATSFAKFIDHEIGGSVILYNNGSPQKSSSVNKELLDLESFGFITGVSGGFSKTLKVNESGAVLVPYGDFLILVYMKDGMKEIVLPSLPLTNTGKQILSVSVRKTPSEMVEHLKLILNGKFEYFDIYALDKKNGSRTMGAYQGRIT